MMYRIMIVIFFFFSLSLGIAQTDGGNVAKSTEEKWENGQRYYLHTIGENQTLYAISKAYGVAIKDIEAANPTMRFSRIAIGQTLKIPAVQPIVEKSSPKDTAHFLYHLVQPKETLYRISKKYDVPVSDIQSANEGLSDKVLEGMTIRIPRKGISLVVEEKVIAPVDIPESVQQVSKAIDMAIVLPLSLVSLDSVSDLSLWSKPKFTPYVEFLEGAYLAIDSLNRKGKKVTLHLIDTESSSELNGFFANESLFKQLDIVYGGATKEDILRLAESCKKYGVYYVSPFMAIKQDNLANPYLISAYPSVQTQLTTFSEYLVKLSDNKQLMLLHTGGAEDQKLVQFFMQQLKKDLQQMRKLDSAHVGLRMNSYDVNKVGLAILQQQMSTTKENVLILLSTNEAFVSNFVRKLPAFNEYSYSLYGMPRWIDFEGIEAEYLQRVHTHLFQDVFVDYSSPSSKLFEQLFIEAYKINPSIYAYKGFDVVYHFTQEIVGRKSAEGISFNGLLANYSLKRMNNGGYENKGITIFRLKEFTYQFISR